MNRKSRMDWVVLLILGLWVMGIVLMIGKSLTLGVCSIFLGSFLLVLNKIMEVKNGSRS